MSEAATSDLSPVSVERDGRVLSGVGVSVESLEKTMDRHSPAPSEPTAEPSEPVQPKTRGAKRFDQLTGEREAEKRRADAAEQARQTAERERDELKAQLAARAPVAEPVAKPESAPAAKPSAPAVRSKPTEDEVGTKYQTYADFIEDLADWKSEQRLAALDFDARIRQSIEADRASRSFADSVTQKLTKAREVYTDFDAVLASGPGAQITLGSSEDHGKARIAAILGNPAAEHIIYAIAKDASLAQSLAHMGDIEFGIAVARLVPADLSVAVPASTGVRSPVIAPAPYQPVGSGSKTTVLPSADLIKKGGFDFDKSGYREKRAAERGVRRR